MRPEPLLTVCVIFVQTSIFQLFKAFFFDKVSEWLRPTLANPIWANPFLAIVFGRPILANPFLAKVRG